MFNFVNVKVIGAKVLSISAGVLIIAFIILLNVKNDISNIPMMPSNKAVGKKMIAYKLATIYNNGETAVSENASEGIWIIISAKCPHCQHILKMLHYNNMMYNSLKIYPIFKEKVSYVDIHQLVSQENIVFPVYKMYNNSVIDSIKYVPTFLNVTNDRINSAITGGVDTESDLQNLLSSLVNKKWRKADTLISQSACSL